MAARGPSRRRTQRTRRRNTASDLGARVWIAIPAAAYAIAIIYFGGAVFAVGVLLLGFVCLHELFRLYDGGAAGAAGRLRRRSSAWPPRPTSAASSRCCWPPWR